MVTKVLKLENRIGGSIGKGDTLIFEEVVFSNDDTFYDDKNGIITFKKEGLYIISWESVINTDKSESVPLFTLKAREDFLIQKSTLSNGFAILNVTIPQEKIFLENKSKDTLYFDESIFVKASLSVTKIKEDKAFGALMSNIPKLNIKSIPTTIPMVTQSCSFDNIDFSNLNEITITKTGIYKVDISLTGCTSTSSIISIFLSINKNIIPQMSQTLKLSPSNIITFSMTNYLSLVAQDTLSLKLSSKIDTTFFFPLNGPGATLSLLKIS